MDGSKQMGPNRHVRIEVFHKLKWVWRIGKEERHLWNLSKIWRWLPGSSQHSWLPILRGPAPVIVPFQLAKYVIFLLCCQCALLPSEPGRSLCRPGALAGPLRCCRCRYKVLAEVRFDKNLMNISYGSTRKNRRWQKIANEKSNVGEVVTK